MTKTPECRGCGRVYVDRQWRYQPDVQPDDVACCPSCLRAEEERDKLMRESARRRAAAQRKDGFGPGLDVFSLLHYDYGDEFWRPKRGQSQ